MITLESGTFSIQMRSADFGDGYRVHLGLNLKRAMDGKPYCTIQTPVRRVHFFTISRFNVPKRWELEQFIRNTANDDVIIRFEYPDEAAALPDEEGTYPPVPLEPPRIVRARLIGSPFETTHEGVRNTIASFEYEELPD